jgi:hypothetical protein
MTSASDIELVEGGGDEQTLVQWWADKNPTESSWLVLLEEVEQGEPFLRRQPPCGVLLQYKRTPPSSRVSVRGLRGRGSGGRVWRRTLGGFVWSPETPLPPDPFTPDADRLFTEFCATGELLPPPGVRDPRVHGLWFDLHTQVGSLLFAKECWKGVVQKCWKSLLVPHPDAYFFSPVHVAISPETGRPVVEKGPFKVFSGTDQLWGALFDSAYQRHVSLATPAPLAVKWAIAIDQACRLVVQPPVVVVSSGASAPSTCTSATTLAELRPALPPCIEAMVATLDKERHLDYDARFALAGFVSAVIEKEADRKAIWFELMQKDPKAPKALSADIFYTGSTDYATLMNRREKLHSHSCDKLIKTRLCPLAGARDIEDTIGPRSQCGALLRKKTGVPSVSYNTRNPAVFTSECLSCSHQ